LFMGSSIIVGKIVKRIGHRRTGLLGGCLVIVGWLAVFAAQKPWQAYPGIALLGFGLNLAWTPGLALLPPHFPSRKATVSGIAVTGSGFGTLFWSSINTVLIDEIGLRSTILVLAGLNSSLCFLAAAGYSPVPTAKGRQAQDSSLKLGKGSAALQSGGPVRVSAVIREGQARNCVVGQSDSAQSSAKPTPLSRDPVLYVLCLASCTGTIGFFAPFTHTAAFAKELGCGEQTGAGPFMCLVYCQLWAGFWQVLSEIASGHWLFGHLDVRHVQE
jgi:MFS family permease